MITIRQIEDRDLPQIQQINFMQWLCVQWNETYKRDNTFAAVNEKEQVLGFLNLSFCNTWYYLQKNRDDISTYQMKLDLCMKKGIRHREEIKRQLVEAAKKKLQELKKDYPDKTLCIRCWCEEEKEEEHQFWLSMGFGVSNIVWIMGYDLSGEIPDVEKPASITIGQQVFDEAGMKAYLEANAAGYGIQDPEAELHFCLQSDDTFVLTAKAQDKIVSSVTSWRVSEEGSTTENVFTIPAFRKQNIARSVITETLKQLKERGDKIATLTCVGDNLPAIRLYTQMGYRVCGHLLEFRYTV